MVHAKARVQQVGSGRGRRKRSVEEAALVLWMVVDEAKSYMADPLTTSEERRAVG